MRALFFITGFLCGLLASAHAGDECDLKPFFKRPRTVGMLGAKLSLGGPREGTERAYGWLKDRGLMFHLKSKFEWVFDMGSIDQIGVRAYPSHHPLFEEQAKNFPRIAAFGRYLAERVSKFNRQFDLTINIGGDHSVAMGSVAGSLKAHPYTRVIWVDAHADINTPLTSPSGNVHGMPLSFLTKYFKHPATDAHTRWMPRLDPAHLAIIGLRDVDAEEPRILKELGVLTFTAEEVEKLGVPQVMDKVMAKLDDGASPFHLSFDVDSINPRFFPCTGTAVAGGLSLSQGQAIMRRVFQTGQLKTLDLVEINPSLGDDVDRATTCNSAFKLLNALD